MYTYEIIMKSKRPDPIATYDTIFYPFDAYIWIFIIISMMAQFLALFVIQNVWSFMSGHSNPKDYIFEGEWFEPICKISWDTKILFIIVGLQRIIDILEQNFKMK